jgi:hypothetical protein
LRITRHQSAKRSPVPPRALLIVSAILLGIFAAGFVLSYPGSPCVQLVVHYRDSEGAKEQVATCAWEDGVIALEWETILISEFYHPGPWSEPGVHLRDTTSYARGRWSPLRYHESRGWDLSFLYDRNWAMCAITTRRITFRAGIPVLVFGLAPALWLMRADRRRAARRRERRSGLCGGCGYDLRASTEVCPECGRPIPSNVMRKPLVGSVHGSFV